MSKGRAREEQGKSCAKAAQELRKSSRAGKKQHGRHARVWGMPFDSVVQDNVTKRKMRLVLRFPCVGGQGRLLVEGRKSENGMRTVMVIMMVIVVMM